MNKTTTIILTGVIYAALLSGCAGPSESVHNALAHTDQKPTPAAEETHDEHESHLHLEDFEEYGLKYGIAESGTIRPAIDAPAAIGVNEDRVAHVVPRISGIANQIRADLGQQVHRGQVLARLTSLELAEAASAFLSAVQRQELQETRFQREKSLREDGISSEEEFIEARNHLAEAQIEVREKREILLAMGLQAEEITSIGENTAASLAEFTLTAPISGVITGKHITMGEHVQNDDAAFIITDTSSVWITISVQPRDLPHLNIGKTVVIKDDHDEPITKAEISFIDPLVDQETRTITARAVVDNPGNRIKPGTFAVAEIPGHEVEANVVIPATAVVQINNQPTVYVVHGEELEPLPVTLGVQDGERVEVLSGLRAGQKIVVEGAFLIKSESQKNTFGDGHNH